MFRSSIFQGVDYDGRALDVWSAGVVLFVLVCAAFPFEAPDASKCMYYKAHVQNKMYFPKNDLDKTVVSLVKSCLTINAIERPSCAEVLQHAWCCGAVEGAPSTDASTNDFTAHKTPNDDASLVSSGAQGEEAAETESKSQSTSKVAQGLVNRAVQESCNTNCIIL